MNKSIQNIFNRRKPKRSGLYVETLRGQIDRNEIDFPQAVDFLVEHGIHELKAIRMLGNG
jgi:hypothetical protein